MKFSLYFKLAWVNLKKNARSYIPYILASILAVMMFYIMCYLSMNPALETMFGGDELRVILAFGTIVIAIFCVIFLFYTNSFLIKRRKKEFGLYNILGMEKKHISGVLCVESVYVSLTSLVLGIGLGILFSKLVGLLLAKLMPFDIKFQFNVSPLNLLITAALFFGIFFMTLLKNMLSIRLSKPVELLHGSNAGEREPKTKWLTAIIGVISLGLGYYIAIATEKPLEAILLFFVAVVLVIIGTCCLFTSGSIALLKLMRKNKKYYYKINHFTNVSGMIYRMRQNAVGLAIICILSTCVLVMISGTTSLYVGAEDLMKNQYPHDVCVAGRYMSVSDREAVEEYSDELAKEMKIEGSNTVSYLSRNLVLLSDKNTFKVRTEFNSASTPDGTVVFMIPASEYNNMQGTNISLSPGEVLVYPSNCKFNYNTVKICETEFKIKDVISSLNVEPYFSVNYMDTIYFIVPDEATIYELDKSISPDDPPTNSLDLYYGVDLNCDKELKKEFAVKLRDKLDSTICMDSEDGDALTPWNNTIARAQFSESSYSLFGGLFFLGIFLGILFLTATILIMYYKQVSEGYEDKSRFEIMQKVGMSHSEVKKTIRSQVLTVFFLPLTAAFIHICFAFKMLTRLLLVLNLTNELLFFLCTLGTVIAFALIYTVVYALTARTYYKIVE